MATTNTTIEALVGANEKVLGATVDFLAPRTNELVQSGLTATSPAVDKVANGPRVGTLPFLSPLEVANINVSTDNINDEGNVESMEADEFRAMRLDLNNAWGFADLQRIVTQYDAKGGAPAMIADWQNGVDKKLLAAALKGVRAVVEKAAKGTAAANGNPAVAPVTGITFDVAGDFDMGPVFAANATAEEWADLFDIMLVSHGRYAKLQADEKSGFLTPSQTGSVLSTYKGKTLLRTNILTDDQVITARRGAVAYGTGNPEGLVPVEYIRKALGGNGGGADILIKRFSRVIHPQGLDYLGKPAKKGDDIFALLSNAANWDLAIPAAQFGFRFINFNKA